jgi:hypothetical protein
MLGNIVAGTFSDGVTPVISSYESIASTLVSGTSTTTITFSSIPSDYKHLQLRLSYNNLTGLDNLQMRLNPDTTSVNASYWHLIYGDGSSAAASNTNTSSSSIVGVQFGRSDTIQYAAVLDLLDYTSTTKNKTLRFLGGVDNNGSGGIWLSSNIYITTAAITSLSFKFNSYNFTPDSRISLYGIKD